MIIEKLSAIQTALKAPKNQKNTFGGYNYRSCEDILEAVKPLLKSHECALTASDEIVQIGVRVYVKSTATLHHKEETLSNTAYAREEETKKGMDGSQITGAASSYARKYALNGLFCIDDTKDADAEKPSDDANKYYCAVCKKEVVENIALKSIGANGKVFCSGTCKSKA